MTSLPGTTQEFGNLLHIKDETFLLHSAGPALQTGLYKGVIAGKMIMCIDTKC